MIRADDTRLNEIFNIIELACGEHELSIINTNYLSNSNLDLDRVEYWFSNQRSANAKDTNKEFVGDNIRYNTDTLYYATLNFRVVSNPVTAMDVSIALTDYISNDKTTEQLLLSFGTVPNSVQHNQLRFDNDGDVISVNDITITVNYSSTSQYDVETFDTVELTTTTYDAEEIVASNVDEISTGTNVITINKHRR